MKVIWTKSKLPLSVLIRWGLDENCSHVAIVFDDQIVFHSNPKGVHIAWYNTFKKNCEIVYEMEFKLPLEQEEAIYQSIINDNDGKSYDYKAFAYFMWAGVEKKFFNKPLPKTNPWDKPNSFICVELLSTIPTDIISEFKKLPKDLSMVSPEMAYNMLRG